ncbi:YjbH domain-containing protein [Photobacterium sp. TY1-4]|uniref:YjbH domain-containing protein n=1 Tax=Photobacterium sp. TY1-4 TaxID=2899122 RepID=UPI0021C065A6|nr:YjbH domain-containing protein [Photobacterium sp. TY1-4]UXI03522.1 YjbH domain-containing protein [Photobacterium sp. TY1-4]
MFRWVGAGVLTLLPLSGQANSTIVPHFSQTGFTGALRTPNAQTLAFGDISLGWNFEDNIDTSRGYSNGAHNTVMLGLGIFPGFEFVSQDTYKRFNGDVGWGSASSDLSFSAKLSSAAWFPDSPFSIAIGAQDLGGIASHHDNQYLVAGYDWKSLRLSVGYGRGSATNQMGAAYLDGGFGSLEWQTFDWMQLVTDYDGTGINAGVRLSTLDGWLPWRSRLSAIWQFYSDSETANRDNAYAGVQLLVPLSLSPSQKNIVPRTKSVWQAHEDAGLAAETESVVSSQTPKGLPQAPELVAPQVGAEVLADSADVVMSRLAKHGFQHLKVATQGEHLSVALENNRYRRNEVDGIGVAMGMISEAWSGSFDLYLLNNGIPVTKIRAQSQRVRDYFQGDAPSVSGMNISTVSTYDYYAVPWKKPAQANSAWIPNINFSPNLRSTLGTEFGVFDYSLALGTNLVWDLWPGASLDVRHLLPLTASDDVEQVSWHPINEHENEVDRVLVHQAFGLPLGLFTQFSYGRMYGDYIGGMNESRWQSASGRHKLSFKMGYYEQEDTEVEAEPRLLSYRYYLPEWDWLLEVQNGEYWRGDTGTAVKSNHWFGDVQVIIEAHTAGEDYAGMYFKIPITPRQEMKPKYVQVTGIDEWRWGYYTKISGNDNRITPGAIWEPELQHSVERRYFNRDRLSPVYIRSQQQRMKQAYTLYALGKAD